MNCFSLFDYSSEKWNFIVRQLTTIELNSFNDITDLLCEIGIFEKNPEFKSFEKLKDYWIEKDIIDLFVKIKQFALNLPHFFPNGSILRLNENNKTVKLKRSQVLCLLCHMILCTLEPSDQNLYWVTFANWLTDGRCCASTYLKVLIEFFRQSFENIEDKIYMENEFIEFQTKFVEKNEIDLKLKSAQNPFEFWPDLYLKGRIGDKLGEAEVDFANCDIGFGITGTQEEMIFGSSPELCIAMLFCDTIKSNQAIIIKGARKIADLGGYGLDIFLNSFISINSDHDLICRKYRIIIAIDALDFSSIYDDKMSLKEQLNYSNIYRELIKAYAGFSLVGTNSARISTGHWGCGSFNGHKILKAIIQLIAANLSCHNLSFFTFDDVKFVNEFELLLDRMKMNHISPLTLWNFLLKLNENDDIFESIMKFIDSQ